jgi:transcriptional regulator with XRE-family HTH domain
MLEISFSNNLRQLMKENEVNQVKLSADINISQSAISAWLSDKKEPSISSLWLLADYFNCSVDELIGRKNY